MYTYIHAIHNVVTIYIVFVVAVRRPFLGSTDAPPVPRPRRCGAARRFSGADFSAILIKPYRARAKGLHLLLLLLPGPSRLTTDSTAHLDFGLPEGLFPTGFCSDTVLNRESRLLTARPAPSVVYVYNRNEKRTGSRTGNFKNMFGTLI